MNCLHINTIAHQMPILMDGIFGLIPLPRIAAEIN